MCNAKGLSQSLSVCTMRMAPCSLAGPATEALMLEQRDTKRRRVETATPATYALAMDDVYCALTVNEEAFPSINWSFDDDEATDEHDMAQVSQSALPSLKRSRDSGMLRSKSLKTQLLEVPLHSLQRSRLPRLHTVGTIDRINFEFPPLSDIGMASPCTSSMLKSWQTKSSASFPKIIQVRRSLGPLE